MAGPRQIFQVDVVTAYGMLTVREVEASDGVEASARALDGLVVPAAGAAVAKNARPSSTPRGH